jgi:hypothetical protein
MAVPLRSGPLALGQNHQGRRVTDGKPRQPQAREGVEAARAPRIGASCAADTRYRHLAVASAG